MQTADLVAMPVWAQTLLAGLLTASFESEARAERPPRG